MKTEMGAALTAVNQGDFKLAFRSAKASSKRHKRHPGFPNIAGIALCGLGKPREAVAYFQKALALAPDFPDARRNLAQALITLGQPEKAVKLLQPLLNNPASGHETFYLLAQARWALGAAEDAVQALSRAISIKPNDFRALKLRASFLAEAGRIEESVEDFRTCHRISPQDPQPLLDAALLLIRSDEPVIARELLNTAIKVAPDNIQTCSLLGMLSAMEGNTAAAAVMYRKVLSLDAIHGEAYLQLADIQSPEENRKMLPELETAIQSSADASHNRALLNFALASVRKSSGDTNGEIQALETANRTEAALRGYDARKADREYTRLTGISAAENTAFRTAQTPVFIIGLPRSGTTLLEQVLSAAPTVQGCGELPGGSILCASALKDGNVPLSGEALSRLYLSSVSKLGSKTTHFIDKLPANYKAIGLLSAAFPHARFLHLSRDPRDIALSMWRGYFAEPGLNFTFDQKAMAHEMNLYRRYMAFWENEHAPRILNVRYENLVNDLQSESRRICEFCGIPWSEAMERPEDNSALVRTASAGQVRKKTHSTSVGGWRSAEKALYVLIRNLDPELWPQLS